MMTQFRPLVYKYLKSNKNILSGFSGIKLVKLFLLTGFAATLAALVFGFFYRIFDYLKTVDIFGEMLTIRLITMVFLSFLSMLIFSNILTSISVFFMSKDVEYLFSTPLKTSVIYCFKFAESLFNSSYMILIFGIPVFAAYGIVYEAGINFYWLMVLVLLPFLIIPAALGTGITQVLMRFLPAKRTHQIMMALGIFFLVMIIILIRFLEPEKLVNPIGAKIFTEYIEKSRIPAPSWLPSTIAAEAIVSACKGEFYRLSNLFIMLVIFAAALFIISLIISNSLYRKGWDESRILKPRTKIHGSSHLSFLKKFTRFFEPKTGALIEKEMKYFFRDTAQWSQLFLLGALVLIYIFNIKSVPVESRFMHNVLAFFNICLAGFVLSGVAVRFAFPSISMERRAFWVIQSSPVSIRKFVLIKFFIYLLPQVILAELIVVSSNLLLEVSDFMFYFSAVSVFVMTCTLTGLGVGLGSLYPDFKADSPDRVAVSAGGVIYMISALGYILVMIILLASPIYSYLASRLMFHNISNFWVYSCYAIAFVISVLAGFLPLRFGINRMQNLEI